MSGEDPHENERQTILTRLLDAVKQCQVRFGGRTELAADADSRVSCLCAAWETALQHGMKHSSKGLQALKQVTEITGLNKVTDMFNDITSKESEPVFWLYAKEHLTKHEQDRFHALKSITTDAGRGRAWLRASLNEHSLERYMHMLLENDDLISQHYESWSFLRDQERSSMMPMMAAGLGSILFAISIDNPDLNSVRKPPTATVINIPSVTKSPTRPEDEPRPVIAGEESPTTSELNKKKEKKKKKKHANIVSFDDDDSGTYCTTSEYDQSDYKPGKLFSKSRSKSQDSDSSSVKLERSDIVPPTISISTASENDTEIITNKITSFQREPSIASGHSSERQLSQSSISSTDFDLSDNGGTTLIPVSPGGNLITDEMAPISTENISTLSSSVDSTDSHKFGDIASAARALDLAQRSMAQSYRTQGDGGNTEQHLRKDGMTAEELKQAVVTMMMKKDEVEEQNRDLQAMLQQEMETTSTLRAEIEEMKLSSASRQEKDKAKYETLQKENELLKHQLRRYVNAVQMLRAEGSQVDDNLGIHLEEPQPSIPPAKPSIDYSHEASEYEKKLIQVAEMHGELMEFNEMLHRQMNYKDNMLRKLQQELVDLRGPLPHDLQLVDEPLTSDIDNLTLQFKTLVNIWIPSAFLQGTSSDSHHVYQVYVRIKDEEWNTYKRYSQFHQLHVKLKKAYPIVSKFEFPPKKTLGKKDSKVVENRRKMFQNYLRSVMNHLLEKDNSLASQMNKEQLLHILPFFSDKPPDKEGKKNRPTKKTNSSSNLQGAGGSGQNQVNPEYTGL